MDKFNVYISGVGGQGIGLISEIMLRAADKANKRAIGVDTHGLAQRGGIVASQLRIGDSVYSPIVPRRQADLLVALERHEAVRAGAEYLKPGGVAVFYNTSWQPLPVRIADDKEVSLQQAVEFFEKNNFKAIDVFHDDLPDPRMQNIALLAAICSNKLIPGIEKSHYESAMHDLMSGKMLELNLELFRSLCNV